MPGWLSLAERRTHREPRMSRRHLFATELLGNPKVAGSNPAPGTIAFIILGHNIRVGPLLPERKEAGRTMRVTLAQLNPVVGDIRGNVDRMVKAIEASHTYDPDLIVFSELCVTGYPPRDLLERGWFIDQAMDAVDELAKVTKEYPNLGVVMGAPQPSELEVGRGLYNSGLLLHQGEVVHVQHKSLLPNYDVFDEVRYFDVAPSIERPPSAELRPDQKDSDTLPAYDVLDPILSYYLEEGFSPRDIEKMGFDRDVVEWTVRTVDGNEYKRRQAAPGLKVTPKAFGVGRRMPVAARFNY